MKYFIRRIPVFGSFIYTWYVFYKTQMAKYRLKKAATKSPLKIVVGTSGVFEQEWTPTDIHYLNILNDEDWKSFFQQNSIDAILAEHVWEHLTLDQGLIAAEHCFKYIKQGGYVRVAVPDGLHPDQNYLNQVKVNGSGAGADDHKVLYDHITLSNLFKKAGFKIKLLEHFDENGNFHSFDWDVNKGMIHRSKRFDQRNTAEKLNYTSIILDAYKTEKNQFF